MTKNVESQTPDSPIANSSDGKVENKKVTEGPATMCTNTKNAVLLETAKAKIYRPDIPHRKRKARIILDGKS